MYKTHGLTKHLLYSIWSMIKQRCYNINNNKYKDYGGRGIIMYDEWRNDFVSFYKWAISSGWKHGLEIDRINNNGNYEPSNCHIVTRRINNANKRNNSIYGTGVSKNGKKFRTLIKINGKEFHIGTFETPEEAHKAYNTKVLEIENSKE